MTTTTPNSSLWPFIRTRAMHAGQRHHRADRQVDAAGDDDDRLGDGGEGQRQHGGRRGPGSPATP